MKQEKTVSILAKGLTTPVGTAQWCKVVRPDTKFSEDGVYSTDLILDGSAAQEMISKLDEFAIQYQKEIKKKLAKLPYEAVVDESGEETGAFKFKFKLNAVTKYGPRRPAVFDSEGQQLTTPPDVGNGSDIRIKCNVKGYKLGPGISLELVGVQIVNLVEFGGAGTMSAIEGGFKAGSLNNDEEEEESNSDWE